jgi:hypothetical protein
MIRYMTSLRIRIVSQVFLLLLSVYSRAQQNSVSEKEEEPPFVFGNVSPVILAPGKIEASNLAVLSSYWLTNQFGNRILDRYRVSRFDDFINLSYGVSADSRWDIGLQLRYARLRLDQNARSSPFKVFGSDETTGFNTSGLASVGLRIRAQPIAAWKGFTIQNTLSYPLLKKNEEKSILQADRWQNDLILTQLAALSPSSFLFFQGRYTLQLANETNPLTNHFPGIAVFYIQALLDRKLFVYPGLNAVGSYTQYTRGGRWSNTGQFLFAGIGLQYQLADQLAVFSYAQVPWYYHSGNELFTRLIRNSYSDFSLGIRLVL